MTITAEQIAELLARAEKHNAQASVAGSATLIWDLAEVVKELVAERDKRVADSNEAQREIDDLTAQVEALAAERDDLRAKLTAAEAREYRAAEVVEEIRAERERQISQEGWTPDHDDTHTAGDMARAAACYAYFSSVPSEVREIEALCPEQTSSVEVVRRAWRWNWGWWKPKSPRRDLIRAAALIVAEIERLDRAALAQE